VRRPHENTNILEFDKKKHIDIYEGHCSLFIYCDKNIYEEKKWFENTIVPLCALL
jgi:hypothetical protein